MKNIKNLLAELSLDVITEEEILNAEVLIEKNVPTSPEKWAKAKSAAKSKFAVYPSAYANGWAAKKYKSMGGGWKSVSEATKDPHEYVDGEMSIHQLKQIKAHAQWILEMLKPETDMPEWVQSKITLAADYLSTACDYLHVELNEDTYTPEEQFDLIEEFVNDFAEENNVDSEIIWEELEQVSDEQLLETAAWRRSAGKDPKGGLNRKGVASYRRENPGSKLKMAVTTPPSKLKPGSKAANRRKSFCARMGGMKGPMKKPNGEPSRKALALRKWNC